MYPIPDGGILELRIVATQAGQQVMNVFHYQLDETGGVPDGKLTAQDFLTAVGAPGGLFEEIQQVIVEQINDIELYAQWILPTRYVAVRDPGGPYAGLVIDDPLPPNNQVAITLRGPLANRHTLGRKGMIGVPRGWEANGLIVDPFLSNYQEAGDAMVLEVNAAGAIKFNPIIYNRTTPGEVVIIDSAQAQRTVRVERRRTVGVGS